ncbi:NAD(P)H-binding protein [Plantactinospora sp. GCM10030261]|uniref:NAD(P)H-binding protein n=1 Tax=Plantactinospora sp. GCM10030261 TaxID=3273420 RepID=UPI00360A80DF
MPTVGVLGATGAVGHRLATVLGGSGLRLRLGARRPDSVEPPADADATVVPVDAGRPADLREFCRGCDAVIIITAPDRRTGGALRSPRPRSPRVPGTSTPVGTTRCGADSPARPRRPSSAPG